MAEIKRWMGIPAGSKIQVKITDDGDVGYGMVTIYDAPGDDQDFTWKGKVTFEYELKAGRTTIFSALMFWTTGSVTFRATLIRDDGQQQPGSPFEVKVIGEEGEYQAIKVRIDAT